ELREGRAVFDQRRHVETELRHALALHHVTVQSRREPEARRVVLLVGSDEPRAERAARAEILARRPLRPVALEIANAAVVEAAVPRDVLERALARHAARAPADHDRELPLVVELNRFGRPDDRLEMAHEAVRETDENHGML